MKYLVNSSVDIRSGFEFENFRGEGRWERNVLNALLTTGRTVHTTRNCWKSNQPMPPLLYDGMNSEWLDDSVLLVHGAGRSLFIETDKAKAYSIQFHETPFGQAKEDFLSYLKQNRIIATIGSQDSFTYYRLAEPFGAENVYHVPGPMVPYVVEDADNFRKPNVTWTYRNFYDFIENKPKDMDILFSFLNECLSKEPEMKIVIIVGLWDSGRFGVIPDKQVIRDWALSFPVMQKYKHLWPRIDILVNLHWIEVLSILKETRWVIGPGGPLGGPPFEAAMYGIPMIVGDTANPFMTLKGGKLFPELLTAPIAVKGRFIELLSKLQNDHSFYQKTGSAYRNYVKNNATFEAYVNQLESIFKQRGWYV